MTSPRSFIFIGRSGSGKGTQAKLLIEQLKKEDPPMDTLYVESGAEFREFEKGETYSQKLLKEILDKGALPPEFLGVYFWSHRILTDFDTGKHLIIDGAPRRYDEALVMNALFDFYSLKTPHVIYINVGSAWAKDRLMARARQDDTGAEIDARMKWFDDNVIPAVNYYRKNPQYAFHDIDGERSIYDIYADIRKILGS